MLPGRIFISLSFESFVQSLRSSRYARNRPTNVLMTAAFEKSRWSGLSLAPSFRDAPSGAGPESRADHLWIPGSRCARPGMTDGRRQSPHLPQHRFDRLALIPAQCGLRWKRIADVVALDGKPGLDAGGQIVAREGFVDAPQPPLQGQRLVPTRGLAEIVELDALARNDAGRSRHPSDPADQHHRGRDMRGGRE